VAHLGKDDGFARAVDVEPGAPRKLSTERQTHGRTDDHEDDEHAKLRRHAGQPLYTLRSRPAQSSVQVGQIYFGVHRSKWVRIASALTVAHRKACRKRDLRQSATTLWKRGMIGQCTGARLNAETLGTAIGLTKSLTGIDHGESSTWLATSKWESRFASRNAVQIMSSKATRLYTRRLHTRLKRSSSRVPARCMAFRRLIYCLK
jgi:hypothetical protein